MRRPYAREDHMHNDALAEICLRWCRGSLCHSCMHFALCEGVPMARQTKTTGLHRGMRISQYRSWHDPA